MASFCHDMVLGYQKTAAGLTDEDVRIHLRYYGDMPADLWKDPMYRKWRRCLIITSLERGLISSDPGMNPILKGDING